MSISNIRILPKIAACFILLASIVAAAIWFASSRMLEIDDRYSALLGKDMSVQKR